MSNDYDGKIVAFMNMKGGVGKTTLCLSLGEYLANHKEKKILFIDIDPQFNLTQTFLKEYSKEDEYLEDKEVKVPTINDIFVHDSTPIIGKRPEVVKSSKIIISLNENIDIIYGSLEIIRIKDTETEKYKLKKFMENNSIVKQYDFIFCDCPPTISVYTNAIMHCADFYVIPIEVDRYSALGIKLLHDAIENEGVSSDREIKMKPLGIIYSKADRETDVSNRVTSLMKKIETSEIISMVGGVFEKKSYLNRDVKDGQQGNIMSKYKNSFENIKEIADEFVGRIAENEKRH